MQDIISILEVISMIFVLILLFIIVVFFIYFEVHEWMLTLSHLATSL